MANETATYVGELVSSNPAPTDPKSQGDDHIRKIKACAQASLPGFAGIILGTATEAGSGNDYAVTLAPAPASYTPLANAVLVFKATHANTGAATLNVNALGAKSILGVDGAALESGDIENGGVVAVFYDGTNFLLISANDRSARGGDAYTGTHDFTGAVLTAATQTPTDNSAKVATTAYVDAADDLKAPVASPAFTGTPTAPTPAPGDDSTKLATTEFVNQAAFSAVLPNQSGNNGKFLQTDGSNALWVPVYDGPISVIVQDQRSSGTDGGSITAGSWQTCPFNTEVRDPGGLASVSSNQITLEPGTYEIRARRNVTWVQLVSGAGVPRPTAQTRLFNITAGAVVSGAFSEVASAVTDNETTGGSGQIGGAFSLELVTVVTLASATTFRVDVFCRDGQAGVTYNHGYALSTGAGEVFGTFEAKRTDNA